MSGKIYAPIVTGFDSRGVDQATSALGKLANSLKGVGISAATMGQTAALAGLTSIFKDSIGQARDLQRNFVALDTVFGRYAERMRDFAKSSEQFGLSSVDSAKASVFLGSVLKQSGFEMGKVSTETQKLVRLASDLATTYGYDVSEALTGMTALFRGEYDPIEKFGVAMKQAEVNALLVAKGQKGLTGAALRNAQAVARLELLYQRAADSMGSFIKQGDSLFVAEKKMSASLTNMEARLGQTLNAPLAETLSAIQKTVVYLEPQFQNIYDILARTISSFVPFIATIGELLNSVLGAFMPIVDGIASLLTSILPTLSAIEKMLKPILDIFSGIAEFIKMIVKWIGIAVKIIGIFLLAIGRLVDWITGGLFTKVGNSLVGMFKSGSNAADKLNDQLDTIIQNMTAIDGTSFDTFGSTSTGEVTDPYIEWIKNGYRGFLPVITDVADMTDELKQKFVDLKNTISQTLLTLIPGDLIEREVGRLEGAVNDVSKSLAASVQSAMDEGLLSVGAGAALMKYAKTELGVLAKLARERDKLAKKYSLAKELIADVKKTTIGFGSLSNIMSKVSSEIVQTITYTVDKFTISLSKSGTSLVSAKSIIDEYKDVVSRTRSFVSDMKKLQNLDLNKTLFQQIVDAGLDSGSAIASALVSGGATAVNELNGLFGELATLGGTLGESTATVMYGAGIDASQGLLDGIMSLDQKYKDAAKALAKSFSDEFNRGIAAQSGSGLKIDTADAVALIGTTSVGRGSTGHVFNVNVNAGMGTDGASVGREIVTAIKQYERISGKVFVTV